MASMARNLPLLGQQMGSGPSEQRGENLHIPGGERRGCDGSWGEKESTISILLDYVFTKEPAN